MLKQADSERFGSEKVRYRGSNLGSFNPNPKLQTYYFIKKALSKILHTSGPGGPVNPIIPLYENHIVLNK
jgi:hypothetical protein